MTVLPFTNPRSVYQRDIRGCAVVRVMDGAGVASQQPGRPVRKVIIARVKYRIPPQTSLAGTLEGGANYNAASLPFIDRGMVDLSNLCRPFGRPATLLRALQAGKQTARGISEIFKFLRCWVGFHAETMAHGADAWNEKPFPNPTTSLPRNT